MRHRFGHFIGFPARRLSISTQLRNDERRAEARLSHGSLEGSRCYQVLDTQAVFVPEFEHERVTEPFDARVIEYVSPLVDVAVTV